ncbi:hypothetical protein HELRODRAFT_176254 [Helobdella robusta]|uniref:Uncharacterized protein n=1 Tax=Helobdella robusta TaxID=6412 RepID=T1FAC2_HELRO|nr:hypothetical protein HELRODRAFT_176254 [Helobdella robusta]ESN99955.1 hypothetical protein HELRODRAFT_176254 [Helobdella robusta]
MQADSQTDIKSAKTNSINNNNYNINKNINDNINNDYNNMNDNNKDEKGCIDVIGNNANKNITIKEIIGNNNDVSISNNNSSNNNNNSSNNNNSNSNNHHISSSSSSSSCSNNNSLKMDKNILDTTIIKPICSEPAIFTTASNSGCLATNYTLCNSDVSHVTGSTHDVELICSHACGADADDDVNNENGYSDNIDGYAVAVDGGHIGGHGDVIGGDDDVGDYDNDDEGVAAVGNNAESGSSKFVSVEATLLQVINEDRKKTKSGLIISGVRQKRIKAAVVVVACLLLLTSFILVGVTLSMSAHIDDMAVVSINNISNHINVNNKKLPQQQQQQQQQQQPQH